MRKPPSKRKSTSQGLRRKTKPKKPAKKKGDLNPMRVMELSSAYWNSKIIHVANHLDIFTRLKERSATSKELALECGADERGIELLLIGCTALGLLNRKKGAYSNSALSKTFLVKGSPRFQGGIVSMFEDWYSPWGELYQSVVKGKPAIGKPHDQSEEAVRNYIMGMHYRGVAQANLLVRTIDVRERRQMLDVAGGPGTFTIFMCRKNKKLKGLVFDLPQTLRITREFIQQFGVEGRVSTQEGNYLEDVFPTGNDVLLLSSMMNQEPPEIVRSIFRKSFDALESGGLLILQEQLLNAEKTGPLLPALIGINQLIHTPGGRNYSVLEFSEWLREIGFLQVKEVRMPEPTPFTVLTGRKP